MDPYHGHTPDSRPDPASAESYNFGSVGDDRARHGSVLPAAAIDPDGVSRVERVWTPGPIRFDGQLPDARWSRGSVIPQPITVAEAASLAAVDRMSDPQPIVSSGIALSAAGQGRLAAQAGPYTRIEDHIDQVSRYETMAGGWNGAEALQADDDEQAPIARVVRAYFAFIGLFFTIATFGGLLAWFVWKAIHHA